MIDAIDIFIAFIAAVTMMLSWQIWRISQAKSILFIFAAMCMGMITRLLLLADTDMIYTRIISVAFWSCWAVGLWFMLRLLQKYIRGEPVVPYYSHFKRGILSIWHRMRK